MLIWNISEKIIDFQNFRNISVKENISDLIHKFVISVNLSKIRVKTR